jgi:hypothetical protein
MRKVSIKLNSRRFRNSKFNGRFNARKLNSATDLVGQEVEVENGDEVSQATIEEVSVTTDEVTLSLDNGDECVLDTNEVEELLEVGEVTSVEPEPTPLNSEVDEVEEFNVTRDVIDAEGNINEVTTVVEAVDEDTAVETVKLIDSRRRRNSRNYRVNSKGINSETEAMGKKLPSFEIVIGDKKFQIEDGYSQGNYVGADSFGDIIEGEADVDIIKLLENGEVSQLRWESEADYEDGLRPQINSKVNKRRRISSLTGDDEVAVTKTKGGAWLIATKGGSGISSKNPEVIIEWLVRKINEVCANGVAKNSRGKNSEMCNFALISTEDGKNYKVEYLSGRNVEECESIIKGLKAKHRDKTGHDSVATQISDDPAKVTDEVLDYLKSHNIADEFVKFEGANCQSKNSDDVEVTETTEETAGVEVTEGEDILENPTVDVEVTETVDPVSESIEEFTVGEDIDRESNSFIGVSSFIKRKYGVNLNK